MSVLRQLLHLHLLKQMALAAWLDFCALSSDPAHTDASPPALRCAYRPRRPLPCRRRRARGRP